MKLIAHRGNIFGPNPLKENSPDYIDAAIELGYDVEIDVRIVEGELYLGHDEEQYKVQMLWIVHRKDSLWIHCKNLEALESFSSSPINFNCFWHQEDDFTLTTSKIIWTYPGKPHTPRSVIVMPENSTPKENLKDLLTLKCYGICSDYVGEIN
jgi:glycerophosphoryl diester phosphodiesterase